MIEMLNYNLKEKKRIEKPNYNCIELSSWIKVSGGGKFKIKKIFMWVLEDE